MLVPSVWGQSFKDISANLHIDLTKQIRQVDYFVYVGPRPRKITDKVNDFQFLADLGIVTDLDLEGMPWHTLYEKKMAPKNGLEYFDVHITPSPAQPPEEAVTKAVGILLKNSAAGRKTYVHCDLGRDRAALIIAEYQIQAGEKTPQDAWNEMLAGGYDPHRPFLFGIRNYFADHHPEVDLFQK